MARSSTTLRDPGFLEAALEGLLLQRERIDAQIREVRELLSRYRPETAEAVNSREEGHERQLSEAARKRIAAAQKKRWAEYRRKHNQA